MMHLLKFSFWFNSRPGALTPFADSIFKIILVLLLVSGIVFYVLGKKKVGYVYGKIWQSLYLFCLANFFLGIVYYFFLYELIPVLSARFWALLWLAEMIFWVMSIVRHTKEIPEKLDERKKEQERQKYIP